MELVIKDPDSIEWMPVVPWSGRLAGDTISTSNYSVPAGLTKEDEQNDTDSTKVKLSGGTLGKSYVIVNQITTTGGETLDYSFKVHIREN